MVSYLWFKGRFIKGNVPWNKGLASPRVLTFICKHCGKKKPLDELRAATRFFPPLIVCQGCWELLEG